MEPYGILLYSSTPALLDPPNPAPLDPDQDRVVEERGFPFVDEGQDLNPKPFTAEPRNPLPLNPGPWTPIRTTWWWSAASRSWTRGRP